MTLRQALLQSIEELEPEAYGPPLRRRATGLLGRPDIDERPVPRGRLALFLDFLADMRELSYGAMYLELDRMEAEGLVESWLGPRPNGSPVPARFYQLTQDGSRERARLEIEERRPVALRLQPAPS